MSGQEAWKLTGIPINFKKPDPIRVNPAECCSAGHGAIWKRIAEGEDECAIVLEHDAIMLHNVDIDIPDNCIAVLGYKMPNITRYDHSRAGPPQRLLPIRGHEGAHAYAITKNTANTLIKEIETRGLLGCVDNAYFLLSRRTSVPLAIVDPTPAIGWLRESTIWKSSANRNYEFIPSFKGNLRS
jgi:GR25 family glycosyltransferase involved in LPS biosynthesis